MVNRPVGSPALLLSRFTFRLGFNLFCSAQESFVEKHRLISALRDPADGNVESLGMVGNVVGVEWPKILLVGEQVHNLGAVWVLSK